MKKILMALTSAVLIFSCSKDDDKKDGNEMSHYPKKVLHEYENPGDIKELTLKYDKEGRIEKISCSNCYDSDPTILTYEGKLLKKVDDGSDFYQYSYNPDGTLKEVVHGTESHLRTAKYEYEGDKVLVDGYLVAIYKDGNIVNDGGYNVTYSDKINMFPELYFLYENNEFYEGSNLPVSLFSCKNLPEFKEAYYTTVDGKNVLSKYSYEYQFDQEGRVTKVDMFSQNFNEDGTSSRKFRYCSRMFIY